MFAVEKGIKDNKIQMYVFKNVYKYKKIQMYVFWKVYKHKIPCKSISNSA